jgi:hypothetical protein
MAEDDEVPNDGAQYCVVCGQGSHRTDWKNKVGDAVACDGHSVADMNKAIADAKQTVAPATPPKTPRAPPAPPAGAPPSSTAA